MAEPPSLAEIKAAYPGRLVLTLNEAAPFIGRTASAAYKLAVKGGLPGAKKLGGTWVVNPRQLAEFIDSDTQAEPAKATGSAPSAQAKTAVQPKGRASRDETSKTVRPPPMSKVLMAMRGRIEQTRAELDLQLAVYAELERQALEVHEAKPRERRRPL